MNTYAKYTANVWVAKCTEKHEKGSVIQVANKYGKENASIIFNLVYWDENHFYYSIVREDGFNVQEWAKRKAERLNNAASNAENKSTKYYQASHEGSDFLKLAEPIKVGHHSEKRHRALIDRNYNRMGKCVEFSDKAKEYESRAAYWESRTEIVNLSMPESIEYFEFQLQKATKEHEDLKSGIVEKSHSFSLTYAKKRVNEMTKNLKTAVILWGDKPKIQL